MSNPVKDPLPSVRVHLSPVVPVFLKSGRSLEPVEDLVRPVALRTPLT